MSPENYCETDGKENSGMKKTRAMFRNTGGAHPRYRKHVTAALPIEVMPRPKILYLSLAQHLGTPSKPLVNKGDAVVKGQPVGEPGGYVSSWLHSPVSGIVRAVEKMATVSDRTAPVIEIETSGEERLHESCSPTPDWDSLSSRQLVEIIAQAGIIGMGGAGFPTHVKLNPPSGKTIDTLIINGAECEPYLTADHRLMVERAQSIWDGAMIIRKILGAKNVKVGIEDNKPDAIEAMQRVMSKGDDGVELVVLKTEYPQGAEKQLIYTMTGREIPAGGLPMNIGTLVENVGTAAAIRDAIIEGLPLVSRVITVSGDCIHTPKNILAPVGTRLYDLVNFCGGLMHHPAKIICGGPMMGITLASLEPGINKTTSGLIFLAPSNIAYFTSMPCIACGRCVAACPMRLMPCTLNEFIEAEDYEDAESSNVMDCIECGSCAFECPAHRPLVQHIKQGKARVMALRKAREIKSDNQRSKIRSQQEKHGNR